MRSSTFKAPSGINRLTFEGVCLLGFACEYYGVFHQENVHLASGQGLYILVLLELFYDTKF